jgi:hypothetical protein
MLSTSWDEKAGPYRLVSSSMMKLIICEGMIDCRGGRIGFCLSLDFSAMWSGSARQIGCGLTNIVDPDKIDSYRKAVKIAFSRWFKPDHIQ